MVSQIAYINFPKKKHTFRVVDEVLSKHAIFSHILDFFNDWSRSFGRKRQIRIQHPQKHGKRKNSNYPKFLQIRILFHCLIQVINFCSIKIEVNYA